MIAAMADFIFLKCELVPFFLSWRDGLFFAKKYRLFHGKGMRRPDWHWHFCENRFANAKLIGIAASGGSIAKLVCFSAVGVLTVDPSSLCN
ncbi:hypothetical protein [Paenibacillus gorillae]|uniref:hypothetical protein n=1 Tax=Paenibacillus gorillae TaxID=1243662 RepID=UPI0004B6AB10|nr:hypothetical protein [Paenibacillus gorillae]